ncbi:uncharacterized protein LOC100844041 [Brachypodium distachyon]|uniref:uncharacterized protein LOC100844041 n=1 Tax=Brachypodium distachyon TaxID=15368 RepID=UPI00052FEF7A|nr:uncharacterized protein LOC100844041 [Brachypodium distachyon]XP_010239786.1 uncharacterized protein LOC100844041 [Brachypodium distachyon]XP_024311689.1 uncharacterized protein LOC100844041 [Brachypodium distachyon]|eukprot:XP_010239785.1 uncharacterized protein LOC100844041 [Brachypodium distachyon]
MMKFDALSVLSNDYMKEQIAGDKLCKLVSKRKKLPHRALDMWKYDRMHQKDIFSEPMVHGMCTKLHNTYKAEFPRIPREANAEIPQKVAAQVAAQIPREVSPFDLNEIAQEVAQIAQEAAAQEEAAQEEVVVQIAQEEIAPFDLNEIAPEAAAQEEAAQDMDVQEEAAQDLDAQEEANAQEHAKAELTNEQRHAVYFALEVIRTRDGEIQAQDKYLIAALLDTSVLTVERIWAKALAQIARGEEVDVSNKKKGNVGRKKKDLDLPRVLTIPLNKRKTIRSLAKSLGVCHSTLHQRFMLGDLKRHRSNLKPSMTDANKIKRLQFCISMLDDDGLATPCPFFKKMDNVVHIDEKWFYMTQISNNYYLLPGEPRPLRTVQNKNSIGKLCS